MSLLVVLKHTLRVVCSLQALAVYPDDNFKCYAVICSVRKQSTFMFVSNCFLAVPKIVLKCKSQIFLASVYSPNLISRLFIRGPLLSQNFVNKS